METTVPLPQADHAVCCHSMGSLKINVQFGSTDTPGDLVDEPVTCCCEKGGSSACMNWNGGSTFCDDPPPPYAEHTHAKNHPYIITINKANTTSSHSYSRISSAIFTSCMCRKMFSAVEVWLDSLPHTTEMADVNLPPNQMTPDEKQTIQRLAASHPDHERFYARPHVKVALRAPPSQWLSEDEDDGNKTRSGERTEDEGEGKARKKFRQLGFRVIRYLRRKGTQGQGPLDQETNGLGEAYEEEPLVI